MWRLLRVERVKTLDLGVNLAVSGVFINLIAIYFVVDIKV